jgi:AcrR family transcriptional regulator
VVKSPEITDEPLNIPDALIAFASQRPATAPHHSAEAGTTRPIDRRAHVLAATRRRLAELGPDKVTLRMLAADCDTSVQTIFNLIGNKSQVLSEAINDYGQAIQDSALKTPTFGSKVVSFVNAMWRSAARNPEYMRQACLSYQNFDEVSHEAIRRAGIRTVRLVLLQEHQRFRKGIDITLLSEALHSMIAATMRDWAYGDFDILKLREHMSFRATALLLGASKTRELEDMIDLLPSLDASSFKG